MDDGIFYVYCVNDQKYTFWRCCGTTDGVLKAQLLLSRPATKCGQNFSQVGVYEYRGQNDMVTKNFRKDEVDGKALLVHNLLVTVPNGTINELY